MTYAEQTGHTAHWNKLSRHWTKEVELDRKPEDSGPEKASCSEQQCYRLFDTQRLEECIDWIHCGSPEGDRTVCERRPPIVWMDAFNHKQLADLRNAGDEWPLSDWSSASALAPPLHGGTDESQNRAVQEPGLRALASVGYPSIGCPIQSFTQG